MKKFFLGILLLFLTVFFSGCAGIKAQKPSLSFSPAEFASGHYEPKVDNFLFILDTSYSMGEYHQMNFRTAKGVISAINQSLPTDMAFTGGLRTFGEPPAQSDQQTTLVYGMTQYRQAGLQDALGRVIHTGGNSPLPKAIEAAGNDLAGLRGDSAIIIVSDGQVVLGMDGSPTAATRLKNRMGGHLCIYTVDVGGEPAGERFLQKVAQAGGCGFSTTAAALAAPGALSSFVEQVFLAPKPMAAAVIEPAAPRDCDGDGVPDSRDKCPDTPKAEIVDANGCSLTLTLHINFDFDKADIKAEFEPDLKKAADFIKKYPEVPYILVEGYTDSVADAAYNQKLSERRAQAVRQYLIEHYGIAPERLVARGGGESNPVASNSTAEGRAQNRRTEITCCVLIPPQ